VVRLFTFNTGTILGTCANLGIQRDDGRFDFIYTHWGGYPEYMGRLLIDRYNDAESARAIVDLGSISSLKGKLAPGEGQSHSFHAPLSGVTVAYGRDRGDEGVEFQTTDTLENVCQQEHAYVFLKATVYAPAHWLYSNAHMPLAAYLEQEGITGTAPGCDS
jgi:hypothetical protein